MLQPIAFGRRESLPGPLMSLLQAVPKTELHTHLAGSAPLTLSRRILREQGASREEIKAQTAIKRRYTDLNDFLATYYVVARHVQTPAHFRRAARAVILEAAKENVHYIEVRTSITNKRGTPLEILQATEAGIRDGIVQAKKRYGLDMTAGVIILSQRAGTSEQSLADAKLAVEYAKRPDSLIVGYDLGGSEQDHAVNFHHQALAYAKEHGLPITVHAGETPTSQGRSGAESIREALSLGAQRIGHGLQAATDPFLMKHLADQQIPVEFCPASNLNISNVEKPADIPLQKFLEQGLNVSLSTDNRALSRVTLTRQLGMLYQEGLLRCWDQLKTLSMNGVRGAFQSELQQRQLLKQFEGEFQRLEKIFKNVINQYFCRTCAHPVQPVRSLNA